MKTISCIIPSYNEEGRILGVLNTIADHPLLSEIIVIDDGSKDATAKVIRDFLTTIPNVKNIKLVVHERNLGKSAAICTGMKMASSEFLLFLDADLVGLTAQNVTDLITPVIENRADVTISLRRNAPGLWHCIGIDYIGGERVFRKSLLQDKIDQILALPRFGLEVFINRWIIKNKSRIQIVLWPNVDSPFKYKKYGWYVGVEGDAKMMLDIFRTISLVGPLYQIWKMRKLRV
jgi:glycosyltransferase involved in cell wall biosynthesis